MVVSFFGGEKADIKYLLRNSTATVLKGTPGTTEKVISSLNFVQRFCSGCLSFNESISESKALEHIREFESAIGAGLQADALNSLWIRHRDKGRDELHFIIPQVDLVTGRQLSIYLDRRDRGLINAFRDIVNIRNGYTRPDDPMRKRMTSISKRCAASKKNIIEKIDEILSKKIEQGQISCRTDVISFLEGLGYEIKRSKNGKLSKEYLKVRQRGEEKYIGLRGAFYREEFASSESLSLEMRPRSIENEAKLAEEIFAVEVKKRAYRQASRHEASQREILRNKKRQAKLFNGELVVTAPQSQQTPKTLIKLELISKTARELNNHETICTPNPFSRIVGRASKSASERGAFFKRSAERIDHILTDLYGAGSEASERTGKFREAIDGCADIVFKTSKRLSQSFGEFIRCLGQRFLKNIGTIKKKEIDLPPF